MHARVRTTRLLIRSALALVLTLALAACATTSDTDDTTGTLAPQASGSFSGGSLLRGSVVGEFEAVGLGNETHLVVMTVDGELWFECRNNGGKLAPGQFAFTKSALSSEFVQRDDNGRFVTTAIVDEPTDILTSTDACKNNWTVNTYADHDPAGTDDPVTFLRVDRVLADLYELPEDVLEDLESAVDEDARRDILLQAVGSLAPNDTLLWDCEDPEPTDPVIEYVAPDLDGPSGVCTLVDGPR